jgi:CheY-like chemotaxis protein
MLIVGSNCLDQKHLKYLTSDPEHPVVVVDSGEEALEKVRLRAYDLIFLDLSLPDISGPDLITKIKVELPEVKVIVTTESNSEELEIQVRKKGIIFFLIKPIDAHYLRTIIDHLTSVGA